MAAPTTKRFTELEAARNLNPDVDVLAIVNEGETRKVTPHALFGTIRPDQDLPGFGDLAKLDRGAGLTSDGTVLAASVLSVAGKTGPVTLDAADIEDFDTAAAAAAAGSAPVQSVAGRTGDIELAAGDITNFDTAAAAAAPVQKVAGRTGLVTLTKGDIGGLGTAAGADVPIGQLISADGTTFAAVAIGAGLGMTGGTLSATGTSLTIPDAELLGGDGTNLTPVIVGAGLSFNLGTLSATGTDLVAGTGVVISSGTISVSYGTGAGTAAQGNDSRITGALQKSSLPVADLLGWSGTAATAVALDTSLSFNLGTLAVASPYDPAAALQKANNLSELTATAATARTNLGLGSMATQNNGAVDINGGAIDGTPVGGTTPAAGAFTTITITSSQTAKAVLAAPSGSAGAPSFRQLSSADISGLGGAATQNVPNANLIGGNGSAFNGVTISAGLTLAAGSLSVLYGTGAATAAQGNDSRITGAMQKAQNLSDVASRGLARMNVDQGEVALTSGATVSTDASLGNMFSLTLGINATLANPTNLKAGAHYMWRITQDGTGSRTLAYGTAFKFPGGTKPTLSTAAGAVDILSGVSDGTNVYAVLTKGFA